MTKVYSAREMCFPVGSRVRACTHQVAQLLMRAPVPNHPSRQLPRELPTMAQAWVAMLVMTMMVEMQYYPLGQVAGLQRSPQCHCCHLAAVFH